MERSGIYDQGAIVPLDVFLNKRSGIDRRYSEHQAILTKEE